MSPAVFPASCSIKRIRPYEGKSKRVRVSGLHPLLLPISAEFFATLQQLKLGSRPPSPWRPWLEGSDGLRHDLPEAAMRPWRGQGHACLVVGATECGGGNPAAAEKRSRLGRVDGKLVRKQ
jgi:hypothetical protein